MTSADLHMDLLRQQRLSGAYIVMAAGSAELPWCIEWACDVCHQSLGPESRLMWNAEPPTRRTQVQNPFSLCSPACASVLRTDLPHVEWREWGIVGVLADLALNRCVGDAVADLINKARQRQMLGPWVRPRLIDAEPANPDEHTGGSSDAKAV